MNKDLMFFLLHIRDSITASIVWATIENQLPTLEKVVNAETIDPFLTRGGINPHRWENI